MSWVRRVLSHFGLARQLPTQRDPDLARFKPKHERAISKAERVLEDYRRADGLIELRVIRKHR